MKKKCLIFIAALFMGCAGSDGTGALKALQGAGYTNVVITGYRFLGCSEDDTYHTGFTATGPTGISVSGVVCSGWMKGSTIRLD